jgi:hypothetical protein
MSINLWLPELIAILSSIFCLGGPAEAGLGPIQETGVTIPPVAQWGLAPSFWAHIPLLAADVAALQEVPGMPGEGQPFSPAAEMIPCLERGNGLEMLSVISLVPVSELWL